MYFQGGMVHFFFKNETLRSESVKIIYEYEIFFKVSKLKLPYTSSFFGGNLNTFIQ